MHAKLLVVGLALTAVACGKSEREVNPPKPRPARAREVAAPLIVPTPTPVALASSTPSSAGPEVAIPPRPSGPSGKALLCHGQTNRAGELPGVRLPIEGLFSDLSSITVELWFRPDTLAEKQAPPEFLLSAHRAGDGRTDSNTDLSVSIRDSRDERLPYFHVRRRADGTCGNVTGSPVSRESLTAGRWYHLAASFERDAEGRLATRTFLDGHQVSSSVGAVPDEACIAPLELTLCQSVTPTGIFTRPFVGALDDVRISRGVRYRDGFVPSTPVEDDTTLLLLRFDDNSIHDLGPRRLRSSAIGALEYVVAGQ